MKCERVCTSQRHLEYFNLREWCSREKWTLGCEYFTQCKYQIALIKELEQIIYMKFCQTRGSTLDGEKGGARLYVKGLFKYPL